MKQTKLTDQSINRFGTKAHALRCRALENLIDSLRFCHNRIDRFVNFSQLRIP